MNNYEKGKRTPSYNTLLQIAKVLKTSVSYFYSEDEQLSDVIEGYSKLSKEEKKDVVFYIKNILGK